MVKFTQPSIQLKNRVHANRNIDRQMAFLLFALALGLYLRTMAPGLLGGDSGEFQFAAWRLGLAHATGYPLYLLLGWLWQHLLEPLAISPATALNALSALFGALAIGTLYIVMQNWLEGPLILRRAIAVFSVLLLTVNPTFWSQSLIAEVYTLHILLLFLLFWAMQRLQQPSEMIGTPPSSSIIPLSKRLCFALLLGLALTHHAMTLLILPSLCLYLGYMIQSRRNKIRPGWPALLALIVAALPLLLYLYIPLRSGPQSSPWYHQPLGDSMLTLYENDWASFVHFITGSSISVGFHSFAQAWSHLTEARLLWQIHFQWIGIVLIILGINFLIKQRNWPLLMLTVPYAILQQIFNLFYAIDDILVYYIPLYVVGIIWASFGVQSLVLKAWQLGNASAQEVQKNSQLDRGQTFGIFVVVIACLLPLSLYRTYLPRLDQRESTTTQQAWESILAAEPPRDAILVSNDRNEIVPLFYLQHVEQRGLGITGLFPLIRPSDDFADVGMVVESALKSGTRPVYLIKEMAGLEVKFRLESVMPPLIHVRGLAASSLPDHLQGDNFGPLRLLGYNWLSHDDEREAEQQDVEIALYWQVMDKIDQNYTTTIQLFDPMNNKIGQDDRQPGGYYYPTSLWKTGEILIDSHRLTLPIGSIPKTLLVGMYHNDDMHHLAPSLEIDLGTILAK